MPDAKPSLAPRMACHTAFAHVCEPCPLAPGPRVAILPPCPPAPLPPCRPAALHPGFMLPNPDEAVIWRGPRWVPGLPDHATGGNRMCTIRTCGPRVAWLRDGRQTDDPKRCSSAHLHRPFGYHSWTTVDPCTTCQSLRPLGDLPYILPDIPPPIERAITCRTREHTFSLLITLSAIPTTLLHLAHPARAPAPLPPLPAARTA